MKIVITGGTGLLGTSLVNYFKDCGNEIIILSRTHRPDSVDIRYCKWDAKNPGPWCKALANADVLINLNGKSVDCRYTNRNKQLIYDTRLDATNALGQATLKCSHPPKLWINAASATIYPHSLDRKMTEEAVDFEDDFSVDVCKKWESAFHSFDLPDTRKVVLRIGIVLSKEGSAMLPLKMLAKLGLGGKIGKGNQMVSWVHEIDFVKAVNFIVDNDNLRGTFNVTSPAPICNKEFMKLLRKSVGVPLGIPTPEWLLALGAFFLRTEPELVLKSRYVIPEKLLQYGFSFRYPQLDLALKDLLKK